MGQTLRSALAPMVVVIKKRRYRGAVHFIPLPMTEEERLQKKYSDPSKLPVRDVCRAVQ